MFVFEILNWGFGPEIAAQMFGYLKVLINGWLIMICVGALMVGYIKAIALIKKIVEIFNLVIEVAKLFGLFVAARVRHIFVRIQNGFDRLVCELYGFVAI